MLAAAALVLMVGSPALAQIGLPATAVPAARDSFMAPAAPAVPEAPLVLRASVSERMLYVQRGDTTLKTLLVAVGSALFP